MRNLAQELDVVPMALYKHVANKEQLLDGMVDVIVGEIDPPVVLDYINSVIGMFRAGGFSIDITHQVMHALGSRMWGFTQEVFPTAPSPGPQTQAPMLREMAARYPYIVEIATAGAHDKAAIVGPGCDDQYEFEFALDLLLDGFERLHQRETASF